MAFQHPEWIYIALPLLLSMLIPATPAGQLLQKTQWGTIGFWVIIPAVGFLIVHAYDLMLAWFSAQPLIAEAVLARRLRERLGTDKDVGAVLDILRDEGFRPGAGRPPFGWRLIELDRQGRPTQRRLRVKRDR